MSRSGRAGRPKRAEKLHAAGVQPDYGAPEEITRMLQQRIPQWADVIKRAAFRSTRGSRVLRHRHRYRRHIHRSGRLRSSRAGTVAYTKSPTTYGKLGDGIFDCFRKAELDPRAASFVNHGTTLVINALIQRAGAKAALVTTEGFRDILEIARGNRTDPFDLRYHRDEPLIPRELRFEVDERIDGTGQDRAPPLASARVARSPQSFAARASRRSRSAS